MTNDELRHHGIKGQQWGRRRYQNKDGSLTKAGEKRYNKELDKVKAEKSKLTKQAKVLRERKKTQSKFDKLEKMKQANEAKKQSLKEEKAALKGKNKKVEEVPKTDQQKAAEIAARREKLLKTSDPHELYKNRDLLSTDEINERLYRISTEQRLGQLAANTKTKGQERMDKIVSTANKVYEISQSPVGKMATKAIKKQLGLEDDNKFDIDKIMGKLDTMSADDLKKYAGMTKNMKTLREYQQEEHARRQKDLEYEWIADQRKERDKNVKAAKKADRKERLNELKEDRKQTKADMKELRKKYKEQRAEAEANRKKSSEPKVEKVQGEIVDDFPWRESSSNNNTGNTRKSSFDIVTSTITEQRPSNLPDVYRNRGIKLLENLYD